MATIKAILECGRLRIMTMREIPMFPLGLVLLPGMLLPLRLFEDRYLQMYADIIDGDREFGVVLIERGIESRDDNRTFEIGAIARVVGSGLNDDGTVALVSVGKERIRIEEWLSSDPYPRARVSVLNEGELTTRGLESVLSASDRLQALYQLVSVLDPSAEPDIPELSDEPEVAIYQMAQLAGLQTLDLQKILSAAVFDDRADLVDRYVGEALELASMSVDGVN